jgi:hypothetical protein
MLTQEIIDWLRSKHWQFQVIEDQGNVVKLTFPITKQLPSGPIDFEITTTLHADDEREDIVILSYYPQKCAADNEDAVASLMTLINPRLRSGCFEMDRRSSRIWFKSCYPVAGDIDEALLEKLINSSVMILLRWFDALFDCASTGQEPLKAFMLQLLTIMDTEGLSQSEILDQAFLRKHFE